MAVIVSSSPAPARRNVQQQQRRRQPQAAQQSDPCFSAVPRRLVLGLPAGLLALLQLARRAHAFVEPPPGYGYQNDKLDGYSFFYPQDWQPVTVRMCFPMVWMPVCGSLCSLLRALWWSFA